MSSDGSKEINGDFGRRKQTDDMLVFKEKSLTDFSFKSDNCRLLPCRECNILPSLFVQPLTVYEERRNAAVYICANCFLEVWVELWNEQSNERLMELKEKWNSLQEISGFD